MICILLGGVARAQSGWAWQPSDIRRMAVTDYSTDAGLQPRIWTDVPGCPGLTLDLDELWRRVEELETEASEP